jgi:hypothetical protein
MSKSLYIQSHQALPFTLIQHKILSKPDISIFYEKISTSSVEYLVKLEVLHV